MAGSKSTVASALLSIWSLCNLLAVTVAQQTVMASNSTNDLPQAGTARYILNTSDIGIPKLRLVPLTHTLSFISSTDFAHLNLTGSLIRVTDNPTLAKGNDIAYISCDNSAYPGQLAADEIVMSAVSSSDGPDAIVLYSVDANHCNYSVPDAIHFDSLFTTIDPMLAFNLQARLANASAPRTASILPDPTSMQQASPGSNSSNGSSDSNNVLGPSPTTAVAMIILYSITGIITALFLIIIVTGAIRAHRHPERYGPRNALGRPRQSRAKGIARAMLEALPIVKFGDTEEANKPATAGENVELGEANNEAAKASSSTDVTAAAEGQNEGNTRDAMETGVAGAHSNHSQEENALGCSICTEDFTKGQDVRVLPCNHKFHPDCVDPWLLNVSGTCPLCRVDLRPTASNTTDTAPASPTSGDLAPPLEEITEAPAPAASGSRHRGSFFHNFRHLRDASAEERMAALRTYHSENRRNTITSVDVAREHRLTSRLRDAFSIRTRREGGENAAAIEAAAEADALDRRRTGTMSG